MAMIDIRQINKYYQNGDSRMHVLRDVTLAVDEGEFVAIMGPSGSGKSTFINIVGMLDRQYDGQYVFDGTDTQNLSRKGFTDFRNRNVGWVFQNFKLIQQMSIFDNVALPLIYSGKTRSDIKVAVQSALDRLGIGDKGVKKPAELSGGQQQRVAIARALVSEPKFLLADEPTGALDSHTAQEILDLFIDLNKHGTTIVMVTHDQHVADQAQRTIRIADGQISGGVL